MISPHRLKPKVKDQIMGWTFVVAALFVGSARGFYVLLAVGIVWVLLYSWKD